MVIDWDSFGGELGRCLRIDASTEIDDAAAVSRSPPP
jgi:hypothetical protein